MIRFSLRCAQGHAFDSWFQSAAAYDALAAAGRLECAVCGARDVGKAPMAPSVATDRAEAAHAGSRSRPDAPGALPMHPVEAAIAAFRRHIEANSEYVGMNFAAEARAIHQGDAPERAIHGEARPEEARRMIEDGLPVAPLPFLPTRRMN